MERLQGDRREPASLSFNLTNWRQTVPEYRERAVELAALLLAVRLALRRPGNGIEKLRDPRPHYATRDEELHLAAELVRAENDRMSGYRAGDVIYPREWLGQMMERKGGTTRERLLEKVAFCLENLNPFLQRHCAGEATDRCFVRTRGMGVKKWIWFDSSQVSISLEEEGLFTWRVPGKGAAGVALETLEARYYGPLLEESGYAWCEDSWFQQLRREIAVEHASLCLQLAGEARAVGDFKTELRYVEAGVSKGSAHYSEELLQRAIGLRIIPNPNVYFGDWPKHDPESFIGRARELSESATLLNRFGLLVLIGAPGGGKTRLAVHLASIRQGLYPGGLFFARMADLPDGVSRETIKAHLERAVQGAPLNSSFEGCLLVVDNCEHLPACFSAVEAFRSEHPGMHFLLTSRFPIRDGERAAWQHLQVHPLAVPEALSHPVSEADLKRLRGNESVRLFLRTAAHQKWNMEVTSENAPVISEICRRLDGIPLAIQVVASQTQQTLDNLAESLASFVTMPPLTADFASRENTLHQCLSWTYSRLLTDEERKLFRWLSVFPKGWPRDAGLAVCLQSGLTDEQINRGLCRLMDGSLITYDEWGRVSRFLEPIRLFAQKCLKEAGEEQAARDFYDDQIHTVYKGLSFPAELGSEVSGEVALVILESEYTLENHEGPLEEKIKGRGWDPTGAGFFLMVAGKFLEATRLFEKSLETLDTQSYRGRQTRVFAEAILGRGLVAYIQNDWSTAWTMANKSYELARSIRRAHAPTPSSRLARNQKGRRLWMNSAHMQAMASSALGVVGGFLEKKGAADHLEAGIKVATAIRRAWTLGFAYMSRGTYRWHRYQFEVAYEDYQSALTCFRICKDRLMSVFCLNSIAHLERLRDRLGESARCYLLSLDGCPGLMLARGMAGCVLGTSGILLAVGRERDAVQFWAAARWLYARIGAKMIPPIEREYETAFQAVREKMGERAFQAAYDRGEQMAREPSKRELLHRVRAVLEEVSRLYPPDNSR